MPSEQKIGKKLFKESVKGKRDGDVVLNSLEKALAKLNKEATKRATQLYEGIFKKLDIDKGTGMIRNSVENLALVHEMAGGLIPITDAYRVAYGQMLRDYRDDTFEMLADKEERIEHHLGKIDMREDRKLLTPEAFSQMVVLNEKNLRKVNAMMLKWKDTVYDLFISGVTRGMDLVNFRNSFFNETGTIKIGSSLEQESTAAAMQSITEQRTAFVRQKAKENGYDYCWNANPLDPLTKPICLEASLAGVIPEGQMSSEYGFPPRYVCRCELVYTRRDWIGVNQGVNQAIRDRRKVLIDTLEAAPKQKSYWYWTNPQGERVRVWAPGKRASGDLMYKETADKLKLVKSKTVPDYKVGRGGPPTPPVTPVPTPKPPAGKAFFKTEANNKLYEKHAAEFRKEALAVREQVERSLEKIYGHVEKDAFDLKYQEALSNKFSSIFLQDPKLKDIHNVVYRWTRSAQGLPPSALKYKAQKLEKKKLQFFTRRNYTKSQIAELEAGLSNEAYIRVRAMTQVYYDELGVKKVKLYRGTDGETGRRLAKDIAKLPMDQEIVYIKETALVGYTDRVSIARDFGDHAGGIVVRREVDVDDIFLPDDIWHTFKKNVSGYEKEHEFIIFGSPETPVNISDIMMPGGEVSF